MSLISILVLILVVLITVDLCRKSIRMKQKEVLSIIEEDSSKHLVNQAKNDLGCVQESQDKYPLLRGGYLLFYFEGAESICVKDLCLYLRYYDVKFTDDQILQKINYSDVIFSIIPDNDSHQVFESSKEGKVPGIIAVMNFKKLISLGYDVRICYEVMMDILESLNKNFDGTLMTERRIRITKRDKQCYLKAIIT